MNRSGFSLLELVVSIGIMGVLMGLLMISMGAAREAARRTSCQNNVRQLGLGLQQFVDRSGGILPKQTHAGARNDGPWFQLAGVLEIESNAAALRIDSRGRLSLHNVVVPLLTCPSDGYVGCNYRTCGSSGYSLSGPSTAFPRPSDTGDGVIPMIVGDHYLAKVRDGLSNTVFASERLIGGGNRDRAEMAFKTMIWPTDFSVAPPHDALIEALATNWGSFAKYPDAGKFWYLTGLSQTAYNHAAPPNSRFAGFFTGNSFDGASTGIISATSNHPGGVNIGRMDGSVSFIGDQVDRRIWTAMATIDSQD